MESVQIISLCVSLVVGLLGYFMKRTINDLDEKVKELRHEHYLLTQDLQETKRTYLHKDDFKEFKQELRGMFEEIRNDIRSLQK